MKDHRTVDIHRIASEGDAIYEEIKERYLNEHKGEFLAINIDTKETFLAETNAEAAEKARSKYPETVFYVLRIGHAAVGGLRTMARVYE